MCSGLYSLFLFITITLKYICFISAVASAEQNNACNDKNGLILHSTTGYLSNSLSSEKGWGSLQCPWLITAQQGQKVDISIIDFNPNQKQTCQKVGYVFDVDLKRNITMCKPNERNGYVHTSSGKSVKIQIYSHIMESDSFLIHYKGKFTKSKFIKIVFSDNELFVILIF